MSDSPLLLSVRVLEQLLGGPARPQGITLGSALRLSDQAKVWLEERGVEVRWAKVGRKGKRPK